MGFFRLVGRESWDIEKKVPSPGPPPQTVSERGVHSQKPFRIPDKQFCLHFQHVRLEVVRPVLEERLVLLSGVYESGEKPLCFFEGEVPFRPWGLTCGNESFVFGVFAKKSKLDQIQ